MALFKNISFLLLILLGLFFFSFKQNAYADSLIIRSGTAIFVDSDMTINELKTGGISPDSVGQVLGTTSGVDVTVTVSLLGPSPTPTPTNTPTPTPTPVPGSPTNTPTPTFTPTPTPIPQTSLIAAVIDDGDSVTGQNVSEVVIEDDDGNTIATLTPTEDGKEIVIEQNGTEATTTFPIEVDTKDKKIKVNTPYGERYILLPDEALSSFREQGSFIIPSSIQISLEELDGVLVYKITGKERARIIQLFYWDFPITIYVKASDGSVIVSRSSRILIFLERIRLAKRVVQ